MSVDWVLLGLRVLSAGALIGFLTAVFLVLWRDYQALVSAGTERPRGRLVVIGVDSVVSVRDGARFPLHEDDTVQLGHIADTVKLTQIEGMSYPLLPLTTLGRALTNTVVLDDSFCSQEHALLAQRGGQWWLEDRNSSNGTLLNGEIVTEPVVVSSGDIIGIGRIELKVELG